MADKMSAEAIALEKIERGPDMFQNVHDKMQAFDRRTEGVRVIIYAEADDGREWGKIGVALTGDADKDKQIGNALFQSIRQTVCMFEGEKP